MKNMMNGQLTEMGVDGFMLDETQGPSPLYSELGMNAQVDYSRWDGCSAILDPTTFAIKQKIGYIALLSEEFEKNLISDYAAQRGLLVVANGAPTTRSRNRDAAMHMVETDSHGIEDTMRLHFTTPLAYFYPGRYDVAYLRRLLERGALPWFTSPSDQLAITRRFFPITVQELRRGWIKGKERVITMNPGSYGWPGETYPYLIWRYAADGTLVGGAPLAGQAKGLVDVQLPPGGIAVLERRASITGGKSPESGG
jgi:hypothetical protein